MEPLSSIVLGCHLPVISITITASQRDALRVTESLMQRGLTGCMCLSGAVSHGSPTGPMIPVVSDADTLRPALMCQLQEIMNV